MKVGDRVRRNVGAGYNDGMNEGDEGVVVSFDGDGDGVHVRADKHGKIGWHIKEYLTVVAPATTGLRIEAGKSYKTRDGRKVGPMVRNDEDYWTPDNGRSHYRDNGVRRFGGDEETYLIAEWVDEPAFKVGDRVRVVNNKARHAGGSGHSATIGDFATLKEWMPGKFWRTDSYDFYEHEIAPVSSRPVAIVCLIENGQPKPATRPYVHGSRESAAIEANRLAGQHKGQEFGVYELVSTAKQERIYEHQWQNTAKAGLKVEAIKQLRSTAGIGLKPAKDAVEAFLAAA